jgi:homogentisate 1,2-dioxygenase
MDQHPTAFTLLASNILLSTRDTVSIDFVIKLWHAHLTTFGSKSYSGLPRERVL